MEGITTVETLGRPPPLREAGLLGNGDMIGNGDLKEPGNGNSTESGVQGESIGIGSRMMVHVTGDGIRPGQVQLAEFSLIVNIFRWPPSPALTGTGGLRRGEPTGVCG